MKTFVTILSILFLLTGLQQNSICQVPIEILRVGYFGDSLDIRSNPALQVKLAKPVTENSIKRFYIELSGADFQQTIIDLLAYRDKKQLDDWLFYQLIRKTAQQLSPKEADYERYTVYKWFLLIKCGYNAQLAFVNDKLLFYVQSDENIYDIPLFTNEGKQFVCLNIHDFGKIDFSKDQLYKVAIDDPQAVKAFSYRVKQIPDFKTNDFNEKELVFYYNDVANRFTIKLNPRLEKMFSNYPTVDFETYFNIPLSNVTYSSLIPELKKKLKGMKQETGIDYLMKFTRHAFMFQTDQENFGFEKRMSPEQTLMNDQSDCDDRVALFYYLVKEVYDLPMIVLLYPSHITVALELQKPIGTPVLFNGRKFSVCEPTPQRLELPVGQLMPELATVHYQVVYEYLPNKK